MVPSSSEKRSDSPSKPGRKRRRRGRRGNQLRRLILLMKIKIGHLQSEPRRSCLSAAAPAKTQLGSGLLQGRVVWAGICPGFAHSWPTKEVPRQRLPVHVTVLQVLGQDRAPRMLRAGRGHGEGARLLWEEGKSASRNREVSGNAKGLKNKLWRAFL